MSVSECELHFLSHLQVGRTTIIVAHRLTTVRNATKIAAVYRGRVLEQVRRIYIISLIFKVQLTYIPDSGYLVIL
jgi:ABC-type transport system involved in Fe-S cluster assembly fused permease/ATPase subunit